MPTRSTGCVTCRRRKIRCDETRPACKKCVTHGVSCPGYRVEQPGGFEFEDQTVLTMQRAKGKQRAKSHDSLSSKKSGSASREVTPSKHDPMSYDPFALPAFPSPEFVPEAYSAVIRSPQSVFLRSPAAERINLYSSFLDIYVPRVPNNVPMVQSHFEFYSRMVEKSADEPIIAAGLDALSLVQVGSLTKDQQMLQQSLFAYGKGVSMLARIIANCGDKTASDDAVLALASLLATCGFYNTIKQEGLDWIGHQSGLAQLLSARGPESLKSELSLLLFYNARYGSLAQALIQRKATIFAQPKWRAGAYRVPIQDYSTLFYDHAIQIPGVLESHDKIDVDMPDAKDRLDRLLADAESLEFNLRNWYAGWHTKMESEGKKTYELRPIEDFPDFTSVVVNPYVTHAYKFPNFMIAYLHSQYWYCMHYLRECTRSLHDKQRDLDPAWQPTEGELEVTDSELTGYAVDLCRTMPYFCCPEASTIGHVSIFLPLRVAAFHFRAARMWPWALWTRDVRDSVFTKGVSQPNVGDGPAVKADLCGPQYLGRPAGVLDRFDTANVDMTLPAQPKSTFDRFDVSNMDMAAATTLPIFPTYASESPPASVSSGGTAV